MDKEKKRNKTRMKINAMDENQFYTHSSIKLKRREYCPTYFVRPALH